MVRVHNTFTCTIDPEADLKITVAFNTTNYVYGEQSAEILCGQYADFTPAAGYNYIQIWISGDTDPSYNQPLPGGSEFNGDVYVTLADDLISLQVEVTPASPSTDCENAVVCECDPIFQVTPPNPPPPPIIWYNTRQCAIAHCPVGQPGADVQVCIEAGQYSSTVSQADADNIAYQVALAQANFLLRCGIGGQLNQLSWRIPCTSPHSPGVCNCSDPSDQSAVATGNPGQTYNVMFRIRGFVECKNYANGGVPGTGSGHLFTCTNPTQAIPAVPGQPSNEYALIISDPPATYFLNRLLVGTVPTAAEVIDYNFTAQIKTGALVTLKARSIDGQEYDNSGGSIVNNAPPPVSLTEPYDGQFLEMLVLSVN